MKLLWVVNGSVTGPLVSTGGASDIVAGSCVEGIAGRVSCVAGLGAVGMVGGGTWGTDEIVGTGFVGQEPFSL